MNKRKIGSCYEKAASFFLQKKGCRLLDTNFRSRAGEIDIIVEDGRTIVFVEVKFRSGRFYGRGEEHVDRRKQQTIVRVAEYYLLTHGLWDRCCRFDVISIDGSGTVTHYVNAFEKS